MRKAIYILLASFIFAICIYLFVFEWVVPKTAAITIPQKWRMIPLRQAKDIVHDYFGEPLPQYNTSESEVWANGSKGKIYFLRIHYLADTVAISYSIHYQFSNWFSSRNYLVDSSSIR
jgi:hypothetical protein